MDCPASADGAPVDVAVVGAGLAGTLAAIDLARRGFGVTLIDRYEAPRREFRAEQLVGAQIGLLEQHGVLGHMVGDTAPQPTTLTARSGRVVERTRVNQFGLSYQDMVNGVRAALPASVRRVTGRAVALATSPSSTQVELSDGRAIEARLLVVATGMPLALARQAGLAYRTVRADHSLTLGFDLGPSNEAPPVAPLVYTPPDTRERIDYLAIFGMSDQIRANLFCYHAPGSDWVRSFREQPTERLRAVLPGLDRVVENTQVTSDVEARSNDLRVVQDPARDGIVLIGDAFQTPCPSAGTGIDRLLSDVAALGRHAPGWFSTQGMGRDKIAAFYADPAKVTADAEALRIAEYRRAVSLEMTMGWRIHRAQVLLRRRLRAAGAALVHELRDSGVALTQN